MNKLAIVAVVVVTGCSSKKSGEPAEATKADDGKTCPMPGANSLYAPRFAVGAIPSYSVPDMRSDHGHLCSEQFTPNEILKMQDGNPTLVAAGTFSGSCKESPGPRSYTAVKPAKLAIDVEALQTNEGELGRNKQLILDSKTPDKNAGISAYVVDRCGDNLETGATPESVTWTLGTGCDKVLKLEPYSDIRPADPKARAIKVIPIAAGTCTVSAEWLGVKGELAVTVK